jgi:thioredoxin-related protein
LCPVACHRDPATGIRSPGSLVETRSMVGDGNSPMQNPIPMRACLVFYFIAAILFSFPQEGRCADAWVTDYSSAVEIAKREGKDLLLVFTGTEWIEMCRVFEQDILNQPAFLEKVGARFVLVKLEFPPEKELGKPVPEELMLLRDAYRVKGFPTVVMTDAEGRPFAINGYQPIASAAYGKAMEDIGKAQEIAVANRKRAEGESGLDKARTLIMNIPQLPGSMAARFYRPELEAVIEADPGDTLGHTKSYQRLIADADYSAAMQKLGENVEWQKMIELTDAYIKDGQLEGAVLQKALLNKSGVQRRQGNAEGLAATLLEIVAIDANTVYGAEAQQQLNQLRAQRLEQELAPQ